MVSVLDQTALCLTHAIVIMLDVCMIMTEVQTANGLSFRISLLSPDHSPVIALSRGLYPFSRVT